METLDGTTTKPTEPAVTKAPVNKALTEEENYNVLYKDNLKEWFQKEVIVLQHVLSMIPDSLYFKIKGKLIVRDLLKSDFEKRSQMFLVNLRCQLRDERCKIMQKFAPTLTP